MSGKKNSRNLKRALVNSFHTVAIDTNIFIYFFQKHPRFGPIVRELFRKFSLERTTVVTSAITLAELLATNKAPVLRSHLQEEFLAISFLVIVPVDNNIAITTADIRRKFQFSLADSIQLATALQARADVFVTSDRRLKSFKQLPIQLLRPQ